MVNQKNSVEHQRTPSIEKRREEQKQQESREVKETSREFVEGVSEVVESVENAEVAERTGEDKRKGPAGGIPVKAAGNIQFKVPTLVLPRIEVMQIQISTEIKAEIAGLEKEAMRVQDNPFALTMAVGKIRYLRDILSNLSHATFETIKALWMKYVRKSS
jgi:hypothetical protein